MNNNLYLDLLKKVLINYYNIDQTEYWPVRPNLLSNLVERAFFLMKRRKVKICHVRSYALSDRLEGRDCPRTADTMIGLKRLENIEFCFNEIIKNNIEGDLIETGAWRGGATIFMQALIKSENITGRKVWVADSFEGLPAPDGRYKADNTSTFHKWKELAVSLDEVKNNFNKYGLLEDNVVFLKGWFKDTLPSAPIEKIALLRLDGDMYESTWDALVNLYPKLTNGGYIIIDDYNSVKNCKQAVEDYRQQMNIKEEIYSADWSCVFWKKEKA